MMFDTTTGLCVSDASVSNFYRFLINLFFKILPMWESGEPSLNDYMLGVQTKLVGFGKMVPDVGGNPLYMSMASTLQYFIDNPQLSKTKVKHDVFDCISICNKLIAQLAEKGGDA